MSRSAQMEATPAAQSGKLITPDPRAVANVPHGAGRSAASFVPGKADNTMRAASRNVINCPLPPYGPLPSLPGSRITRVQTTEMQRAQAVRSWLRRAGGRRRPAASLMPARWRQAARLPGSDP
jgi:hypothetical protein